MFTITIVFDWFHSLFPFSRSLQPTHVPFVFSSKYLVDLARQQHFIYKVRGARIWSFIFSLLLIGHKNEMNITNNIKNLLIRKKE